MPPDRGGPQAPSPIAAPGRRAAFTTLLLAAMASGTFLTVALGLLATFLIDDFGITRAQLGIVIAVTTLCGAFASPLSGRVTDRIGGRNAFALLFAVSGAAFLLLAAAPAYLLLFPAAVLAGVGQSAANPATNKLIALHLPPGRRGTVTGIKQSGVQVGVFIGGLAVPSAALAIGWRPTVVAVAAIPLAAIPAVLALVPADRPAPAGRARRPSKLPPAIAWLTAYGFLLGFAGGVTFLIPLFAEEALGLSPAAGGAAAGLVGFVAVFGRIGWARAAERLDRFAAPLAWIGVLSIAASGVLLAATTVGPAALWVGAVATGISSSTWNSVGMLAVMDEAGPERAGQASGLVMLGFLAGLGAGPPLFGLSVDVSGSYATMWWLSIAAGAAGAAVAWAWERTAGAARPPA